MLRFIYNTIAELLQPTSHQLKATAPHHEIFEIRSAKMAHFFCRVIPSQCPFERDVRWFGQTLFHIPPMCKLNPFYQQLIELRFKALCYLADQCGEDITLYC